MKELVRFVSPLEDGTPEDVSFRRASCRCLSRT